MVWNLIAASELKNDLTIYLSAKTSYLFVLRVNQFTKQNYYISFDRGLLPSELHPIIPTYYTLINKLT